MFDKDRLQNVKEKEDGSFTARCPACAADGADGKGEHLIVYADGRFGCVKHQGDRQHRGQVLKLAGDKSKVPRSCPGVDLNPVTTPESKRILVVGRLGQKKPTAPENGFEVNDSPPKSPPPRNRSRGTHQFGERISEETPVQHQPWNEPGRDPFEAAQEFLSSRR